MVYSLLCDIGNSGLKLGFDCQGLLSETFTLPTQNQTADSLGIAFCQFAQRLGLDCAKCSVCVAASVVPRLDSPLREAVRKYFNCQALFIGPDIAIPLENHYVQPDTTGADRLVAAYAAKSILPLAASIIVADFGSAITFDCVCGNAFMGGLIFPGPKAALSGLAKAGARLPLIGLEPEKAHAIPGRSTESCIRNGVAYGYACLTEGLCALLKKQLPGPWRVVGCGGFARKISGLCPVFDLVRPRLVLEGLAALARAAINKRS